ncbi:MAG: LysR substrate-binding domain-containing protein [Betaproteobacteria bacterium]
MMRFDARVGANLKPRHLQLLVCLDDFRSLVKVADYFHITQPAVSKALADLERMLEVRLFERTGRGLEPTIYGQCMIRHARGLLSNLQQAREELISLRNGDSGRVAVGVLPASAPVLIPKAIATLKLDAPYTTVLLHEGPLAALLPELQVGNLDLIVGTIPPARLAGGLATEVLYHEDPIVLVAGAHHPLLCRRKLRWEDLVGFPWIIPPPGASMREPFERALAERGLPLPANRVESVALISNKTILLETLAIGFFSKRIAEHYGELGLVAMLPLELPNLVGPIGAMWIRNKPQLPAVKRLLSSLKKVAAADA